jgi:DNA-binding NarL/FixJ family response regulator
LRSHRLLQKATNALPRNAISGILLDTHQSRHSCSAPAAESLAGVYDDRALEVETGLSEEITPRETDVLRMLAEGLVNKDIATRLGISEHTVKFHISSILDKLGASTRTEAVALGIRRELIPI